MGKTRRQEEADAEAHHQSDQNSLRVEAHRIRVGIADHQVGNQGGNARGEEHGVDVGAELLPAHQAVNHHAEEGGPDVQNVDAPGGEAQSQNKGQVGHVVGRAAEDNVQQQAQIAHQSHIQEGGTIAAYGEVVGGQLTGLTENLPQARKHTSPIRHKKCRNQEKRGETAEKQLQKVALSHRIDFFHFRHLRKK